MAQRSDFSYVDISNETNTGITVKGFKRVESKTFDNKYAEDFQKENCPDMEYNLKAISISIENIIMTNLGERIMLPEFGCNAIQYIFENYSGLTNIQMLNKVTDAIVRWEPRVEINMEESYIKTYPEQNALEVYIVYRIIGTNLIETFQTFIGE